MKFIIFKKRNIKVIIPIIFCCITNILSGQCPTPPNSNFRNNGTGGTCMTVTVPSGLQHTGRFTFQNNTGFSNNQYLDKVLLNGQLYQEGQSLYNNFATIWFGGYNASSEDLCFYGIANNDNAVPAGQWSLYFRDAVTNTTTTCTYTINSSGNTVTFTAGEIGSNQTICSGSTPSSLTSVSDASNCTSPGVISYKWRKSTTSSTNGFSDIPEATSSTYAPGVLTQTTYFTRIATCSGISVSANSNVITISVVDAGTISASPSTWTAPTTTTFSSTGTAGGTWSSSNTAVATINSSTGVLTTLGAGTTNITYTVLSGCTSSKNVTITNNNGTLPVTWESITAEKQNSQSLIKWSTASEQNTKDFEIQYSTNTTDWSPIGTVLAAGNSSTQRNYSFVHTTPLKNNNYNYYRILQRDLDGKFSYSKIVSILFNEAGPEVVVYPNPVNEVLTIYTSTEQVVSLYNAAGSLVWKAKLPAGRNQLPVNKFSKGVYILVTDQLKTKVIIH